MNSSQTVSEAGLRKFSPLDGLKAANLTSLAPNITLNELAANRVLFRAGDSDRRTLWLVSGRLEMRDDERTIAILSGGTPESRAPLAPTQPRKVTARAVDPIQYLSIDSALLDALVIWDQTGIYEVAELASRFGTEESDWMTKLLLTQLFQRIPPANLQGIFMRMQRINCRAGEVIIRQGSEGDCFFAIVSGKCAVIRETPLNRDGIRLADLEVGATFGEEALIAETPRNATVRMLTDGSLMRLAKQDFQELVKEPLRNLVDYPQACKLVERGARWLDVRMPNEHKNLAIDGGLNLPLYMLRLKLSTLDSNVPYVVYCDTGRRSAAAAFIFLSHGFEAYVLRGGLASAETPPRRST